MEHPSFSLPCCAGKILTVGFKTCLLLKQTADSNNINILSQFLNICCRYQNTHWECRSSCSISDFSLSIARRVYRRLSRREYVPESFVIMFSQFSTKQTTEKRRGEESFEFVLMKKILKARTGALQKRMLHFKGFLEKQHLAEKQKFAKQLAIPPGKNISL